jgi:hypothetical protein
MGRTIEVRDGAGGACGTMVSQVAQSARDHRTLRIGVLYAMTIVAVLAAVAKLH